MFSTATFSMTSFPAWSRLRVVPSTLVHGQYHSFALCMLGHGFRIGGGIPRRNEHIWPTEKAKTSTVRQVFREWRACAEAAHALQETSEDPNRHEHCCRMNAENDHWAPDHRFSAYREGTPRRLKCRNGCHSQRLRNSVRKE